VNLRLNLAPWLNRNGRLFLVLPEQPVTPVKVSWTTQGRLLPGQLVSGQRALVYVGPIVSPLLEETLVLKMEADGTRLSSASAFSFISKSTLTDMMSPTKNCLLPCITVALLLAVRPPLSARFRRAGRSATL